MSEPMTKLLALEITVELWRWLEKNPGCHKQDWPRWKDLPKCTMTCACCEHVKQIWEATTEMPMHCACASFDPLVGDVKEIHDQMLALCPLKSLWPNGCESEGSPYDRWSESDNPFDAYEAAKEIADAAEKEIALLLQEQKQQQ